MEEMEPRLIDPREGDIKQRILAAIDEKCPDMPEVIRSKIDFEVTIVDNKPIIDFHDVSTIGLLNSQVGGRIGLFVLIREVVGDEYPNFQVFPVSEEPYVAPSQGEYLDRFNEGVVQRDQTYYDPDREGTKVVQSKGEAAEEERKE